jgi:hypothetical protein
MLEFDWRPGIGDPTIGGWLTVILYFLTMVSCWRTAFSPSWRNGERSRQRFFRVGQLALGFCQGCGNGANGLTGCRQHEAERRVRERRPPPLINRNGA